MKEYKNNVSIHILPTASNLLGICFLILSLIKIIGAGVAQTVMDQLVGVAILLFLSASLLSYLSIRSKSKSERYEIIADNIFLVGLIFLTVVSLLTVFELVK